MQNLDPATLDFVNTGPPTIAPNLGLQLDDRTCEFHREYRDNYLFEKFFLYRMIWNIHFRWENLVFKHLKRKPRFLFHVNSKGRFDKANEIL